MLYKLQWFDGTYFFLSIKNQLRFIMHNEITEILSRFLKVILEENKTFVPLGHAAISVTEPLYNPSTTTQF